MKTQTFRRGGGGCERFRCWRRGVAEIRFQEAGGGAMECPKKAACLALRKIWPQCQNALCFPWVWPSTPRFSRLIVSWWNPLQLLLIVPALKVVRILGLIFFAVEPSVATATK